jgi:hypothetical protein
MRRRLLVPLVAAVTTMALSPPSGEAAAPTAPPPVAQEITPVPVLTLCGTLDADANRGSDGRVRGFASGAGEGCDTTISFFRGAGSTWTHVRTPYHGRVLGSAVDGTGTYLLYLATDGVRLGKRTSGGAFRTSRLLSRSGTDGVSGDIAARGGRWWAVWSEPVGRFDAQELFQAKTYGTDVTRQRLTHSDTFPDIIPRLTLRPRGATLVWQRYDAPVEPESSDIWQGTSRDGAWTFKPFLTLGRFNETPDIASTAGRVAVGWIRDRASRYAESTGGPFHVTVFPRPEAESSVQPKVSVAGSRAYLGWIEVGDEFEPLVLATRRGGVWDRQVVTGVGPAGSGRQKLHAVAGAPDRATVLFSGDPTLRAATVR